jgi:hypothetical protein
MPRILLGLIFDVVAGLVITGALAALVVTALPTRPGGQGWLWLLAIVSSITVGTTRRCLVSGSRGRGPLGWARRIASRAGRER